MTTRRKPRQGTDVPSREFTLRDVSEVTGIPLRRLRDYTQGLKEPQLVADVVEPGGLKVYFGSTVRAWQRLRQEITRRAGRLVGVDRYPR